MRGFAGRRGACGALRATIGLCVADADASAPQFGPGGMRELAAFDTADGLYDCCWSEARPFAEQPRRPFRVN